MAYTRIFSTYSPEAFLKRSLETFRHQAEHCELYKTYVERLSIRVEEVDTLEKIPFLPIEFFKNHKIISDQAQAEKIFTSSGTTGSLTSKHYVRDLSLYEDRQKGN